MSNSPKTSKEPNEETPTETTDQQMDSPFKPLLWLLIPLVACIIYGILSN